MTEWSVETCSPIISSNKCCADVNNWLILWKDCCTFAEIQFAALQAEEKCVWKT